ncbi:MAG: DUF4339 domain-containing protein [Acidobacteria bacterium]|nr:MAG: DUF4339 domain-containing protein [Acidobacteriota bacterium]
MIFATVQGPVPPAPMQLQIANQARSLVEQLALAPLQEAGTGAAWVAIVHPTSVVLVSGERSLVAQLQFGTVVTLDMAIPSQAAWSIVWDSPGAAAESLLSGVLSGGSLGPGAARPAVRIGGFQGDRRLAETSFDAAGGWQDDLDDRALNEEVNRRLEEAGRGAEPPEGGIGAAGGHVSVQSSPGAAAGVSGASGISGGVLAGAAAAVAGVAAAAIAREVIKKRTEPEPPASSTPPPPVSTTPTVREWYYMQGARQEGPVTEPVIRNLVAQGIVRADTMVWSESLTTWTTAAQAGLAAQPPVSANVSVCPRCGRQTNPGARFCGSCGQPLG